MYEDNALNFNKWEEEFVEMVMILLIELHCISHYNLLIIQSSFFGKNNQRRKGQRMVDGSKDA